MSMSPALRKVTLTVHIACSVGWLGAIAAYLALNIPALASDNIQTVRAAYLMMLPVGWYAIVPLATATLLTGIMLSLGTAWGLFRYYWVVFSLIITIVAFAVLLGHMADVSALAAMAADTNADTGHLAGDLPHSVGGLIVLLVPLVLNIYKPRGLTRYGARKQRTPSMTAAGSNVAEPNESPPDVTTEHRAQPR